MTPTIQGTPPAAIAAEAALELTVSMPAYNTARYVRQAIESVLSQEGIDFELIVVDDGSKDGTGNVVESIEDPRVRLIRNPRRRGIGFCHNAVLRLSRAAFIAHVDADDFLLPGALRKLVDAVRSDARIGQAHCYFFDVDENGETTPEDMLARCRKFHRERPPGLDYRARLAHTAGVINHLRTYRKTVLEACGGFNERLRFGVDYDMALRIVEGHTIKLVPEFLYCRRVHSHNTSESLYWKTVRFSLQKYRTRRRLIREGKVTFLTEARFDTHQVALRHVRRELVRLRAQVLRFLRLG